MPMSKGSKRYSRLLSINVITPLVILTNRVRGFFLNLHRDYKGTLNGSLQSEILPYFYSVLAQKFRLMVSPSISWEPGVNTCPGLVGITLTRPTKPSKDHVPFLSVVVYTSGRSLSKNVNVTTTAGTGFPSS